MEPTRKANVISWLALGGAVASLAFALFPRDLARCSEPPMSPEEKCWVVLTLIWLALATFASWKYRTAAARRAFWILFPLSALIAYGTILHSADTGFFP